MLFLCRKFGLDISLSAIRRDYSLAGEEDGDIKFGDDSILSSILSSSGILFSGILFSQWEVVISPASHILNSTHPRHRVDEAVPNASTTWSSLLVQSFPSLACLQPGNLTLHGHNQILSTILPPVV